MILVFIVKGADLDIGSRFFDNGMSFFRSLITYICGGLVEDRDDRKDAGDFNVDDAINDDVKRRQNKKQSHQEIKFKDYLELIKKDPKIAQNSLSRLLEIVYTYGVEEIPEHERFLGGSKHYGLFSQKLFGLELPIENVVEHMKAGAENLTTGKKMLLLIGPPGSGKSTIVEILKRAAERYENRPVFMIKGCPIWEEPLHLLSVNSGIREKISQQLGIKIEGDLCPVCRDTLKQFKDSDSGKVRWWDVPVVSFRFSIQNRRGIGSYEPGDDKSSSVNDLVGHANLATMAAKGHDHPDAYTLDGDLVKANRGVCEFREWLKNPDKLNQVCISVAEEKVVKVYGSSFPHIHLDTLLIGHSNLSEYKKFNSKDNEALHRRTYVVYVPLPLRIKDEIKIYHKLIHQEANMEVLKKCHIAPGALEIAATFAVMTRLSPSKTGISNLLKAKLYNGDKILTDIRKEREKIPLDVPELLYEGQTNDDIAKREGMFGISASDILDALNKALIDHGNGCLTPRKVIMALRELFEHKAGNTAEDIKRYMEMLSDSDGDSVMVEYKSFVKKAVKKAFLKAYPDMADKLFNDYLYNARLYRQQTSKYNRGQLASHERDDMGKPIKADEEKLESVEAYLGVDENAAKAFRGEVLEAHSIYTQNNTAFNRETYPPLGQACEQKLLSDCETMLDMVLDDEKLKSAEASQRAADLFSELTSEKQDQKNRFCNYCAREIMKDAKQYIIGEKKRQ